MAKVGLEGSPEKRIEFFLHKTGAQLEMVVQTSNVVVALGPAGMSITCQLAQVVPGSWMRVCVS